MPTQPMLPGDPDETISPDDPEVIRRLLLMPWILWGAMVFSVAMYGVISYMVVSSVRPGPPMPDAILYGCAAAALALLVVTPIMRRRLMPPASLEGTPHSLTRARANEVASRFFPAFIVTLALSEAIAIFGLIVTFLGHDLRHFAAFAAVSLVSFILYRPSPEAMRGMLRAAAAAPLAGTGN